MARMQRGYRRSRREMAPSARTIEPFALEPISTPERYPPPAYAATIWLTPNAVMLSLGATLGEQGHAVALPFREASWAILLDILRERSRASERSKRVIGTRAAPVAYDIEAMLRAMGASGPGITKVATAQRHAPPTTLRDLGLTDDEQGGVAT